MPHITDFAVERSDPEGERLIGKLTQIPLDAPMVAKGYAGALRIGAAIVYGRWGRQGEYAVFTVDPEEKALFPKDLSDGPIDGASFLADAESAETVEAWDFYWANRAELVLDRSLEWRQRSWASEDEHWDHHHCDVCWEKIGTSGIDDFYEVGHGDWVVCPPCHESLIEPRVLDFRPMDGPAVSLS